MKYFIFDKLLHVETETGNHNVATDSENFDLIRDSLLRGEYKLVDTLLRAENRLDVKNLTEVEGEYYFRDTLVPTSVCDLLMNHSVSSLAVLNYWINRTVKDQSISVEILRDLIGTTVYPVDKSGFLFISEKPIDGPEFFQCQLTTENKRLFRNGIEGLCQHYFKTQTKKLVSLSKKQLFRDKVIDNSFFNTCQFIAEYQPNTDHDTLLRLIDSPLVEVVQGNEATIRVVASLFNGVFNADKLIRLLDDENEIKALSDNFKAIAQNWKTLEGEIQLKSRFQNISDLVLFLDRESKKQKTKDFQLKQNLNFPWALNMEGTLGDFQVKLAESKYELIEWSTTLGNCLDRYPDKVRDGKMILIGLMVDNAVKYAVEIKADGSLGYFEGKSRSNPSSDLKAKIINLISQSKG